MSTLHASVVQAKASGTKLLAILVDPEKFDPAGAKAFLARIPEETSHLLVGGSTMEDGKMDPVLTALKASSNLPVLLFPGSYRQLSPAADALLLLSLVSGRNPEYLIEQQIKAVPFLRANPMEVIPTAYLLIDGGNESAVARVTGTAPMNPTQMDTILDTAKAAELMGAKMLYLEAGSGAINPVPSAVIRAVSEELDIPLIVGGGIRSEQQKQDAYRAGADMIVIGTALEESA